MYLIPKLFVKVALNLKKVYNSPAILYKFKFRFDRLITAS